MASGDEWTQVVKSKHKRTQVRPTPTLSPIRTTEQNIPLQSIRNRPILKQTPPEDSSRGYRSHERSSLPPGRYTYIERREYNVSTYKSGAWESEQYFERRTDLPSGRENQKLSLAETRFTKRPGVIVLPQKPNKPKKSKRKKTDSRYLRSVNEVSLSLSDVLREVPKNKDTNRTRISTGVSIVSTRSRTLINTNSKITPRNVLDSTAPLVRRGKERITPKNKKPTKLKRLVLEERRLIKLQKELKKNPNSEDTKQLEEEEEERHQTLPEIRISFIDSDLNEHEAECTDTLSDPIESGEIGEQKNDVIHEDKPLSENENSSVKEEVVSKPETAKIEIEPFEVSFLGEGLPGLHTKKFREYCYQMPDKKVDELTNKLLYELMKLQARQHDTNKMKAKGKKRLVFGFHEVSKHLRVEHLKCIVIARDLERSRAVGGLEHQITTICSQCSTQSVQVIFALTKHTLSFSVCKPKTIVSIVGILNYEGRQEIYKELVKLVVVKQDEYFEIVEEKKNKVLTVHEDTGLKIKQETSEYVEPDTPNNSNTNSSSFSNTDSVTHGNEPLRLKRFEPKDVETTNEFIPNSFISHNYPYPGIYASQYIQHYNYPHYQALYSQYYYYPAAYSHTTQYSRYNQ